MHFLADEAAAEEARLRESLASVGEVGELWEQIKRSVYAAFLPLPAELGARCEGLPSHEIEPAAREVVYAAMSDLSRGC
ncbi:MAG: hypothetical protein HGB01_04665 [Chlorobiaceae bacterium]|nr:hypothetical protein [Chlorobiaceae bacterium]